MHKSVLYHNDALGEIIRYKAWLIEKEYSQVVGVDFNKTFALMAKFITIRCIFALETAMDWVIHHMDIKISFSMDQMEGIIQNGKEDLVCKLKKTLYGLKQLPRTWYHRIDLFYLLMRVFVRAKRIVHQTNGLVFVGDNPLCD